MGIVLTTGTAATAAMPTPKSLGLSSPNKYFNVVPPKSQCGIADKCLSEYWSRQRISYINSATGYANGRKAGTNRANDMSDMVASALPADSTSGKAINRKYTIKGKQHELWVAVYTSRIEGTDGAEYYRIAIGREFIRKSGSSGPYQKKTGVGFIEVGQLNSPLSDLTPKKMADAMRSLMLDAYKVQLSGPIKPPVTSSAESGSAEDLELSLSLF